jgi:hypothetical protein
MSSTFINQRAWKTLPAAPRVMEMSIFLLIAQANF